MKKIRISDHFGISTILLFSLPSIGTSLVNNTYQVADGYFISNYIGSSAFAAENLVFPPLVIVAGIGMMFGSGAAALISHSMGEGEQEKANSRLSLMAGILAVLAVLASLLLFILMPSVARWVGAAENLVPKCVEYGRILAAFMPFMILNSAFRPLLVTADRPGLGLVISIVNAAINIVLDWVTVALLGWGLTGAALATGLAWAASAMIPLFYFADRKHPLHFGPFRWNGSDLGKTCYNGASEMTSAVSYALVAMLFNFQLLRLMGEKGVDAYAVSGYMGGIYSSVFFGIAMSITPVVGYHLGENNRAELRNIRKNGFILTGLLGLGMAAVTFAFARPVSRIFVGYDAELTNLAVEAMRIIAFAYILSGITTFSSSFFTGMGDGTASLAVAVVKSLAVPFAALLVLPRLFGRTGIWLVTPLAEVIALAAAVFFFLKYRRKGLLRDQ